MVQGRRAVKDMEVIVKTLTGPLIEEEYDPHEKSKKETINLEKTHYHIKNNTPSGKKLRKNL